MNSLDACPLCFVWVKEIDLVGSLGVLRCDLLSDPSGPNQTTSRIQILVVKNTNPTGVLTTGIINVFYLLIFLRASNGPTHHAAVGEGR